MSVLFNEAQKVEFDHSIGFATETPPPSFNGGYIGGNMNKIPTPEPFQHDAFISIAEAARRVVEDLRRRMSEQESGGDHRG